MYSSNSNLKNKRNGRTQNTTMATPAIAIEKIAWMKNLDVLQPINISQKSNASRSLLILIVDVLLEVGRRQEVVRGEAVHIEIGLLHRPRLLQLALVVDGALAVAEERDVGVAAVRDVDAVDAAVVGDDGLHAGLPEDVLAAAVALAGLHAQQVRVLELDEQPRALAEVAPHRVVDDVERRGAPRPQRRRAGLQLEDEALLVVEDLLAYAHRVGEEVRDGAWIQALRTNKRSTIEFIDLAER